MNPESIGTPEELQKFAAEEEEALQAKTSAIEDSEQSTSETSITEQSHEDKKPKDKFLMLQDWLDDEESTVANVS